MRFPLAKRIIDGYKFRQKTSYSLYHLGTDYRANFENLFAPTDGNIEATPYGKEGGQWLHFRDSNGYLWRFGHLSKVLRTGKISEGEIIAITGNSGSLTTNPHLHIDITKIGLSLNIKNINNFIDPESYIKETGQEGEELMGEQYNELIREIHRRAVAAEGNAINYANGIVDALRTDVTGEFKKVRDENTQAFDTLSGQIKEVQGHLEIITKKLNIKVPEVKIPEPQFTKTEVQDIKKGLGVWVWIKNKLGIK